MAAGPWTAHGAATLLRAARALAVALAMAGVLTAVLAEGSEEELPGEHVCRGHDEEVGDCPEMPPCRECEPVDCAFNDWGEWYLEGGCTGLHFRHRSIKSQNNECGKPCDGPKIMSEEFLLDRCRSAKADCEFGAWSEWTACASEQDQSIRSRAVERPPSADGEPCRGGVKETKACGAGPTPRDCELTSWQEWTTCSATCGEGRHSRMRRVAVEALHNGATCQDVVLQTESCRAQECPVTDCRLSEWYEWSGCSGGHSQRYRYRKILTPPLNGKPCLPGIAETEACPRPTPVDCELSEWAAWSRCDKSCLGGQTFRSRRLVRANSDGGACAAAAVKETATCNTGLCGLPAKSDCLLSPWSPWSGCSAACGPGSATRTRRVQSLADADGRGCEGPLEEIKPCLELPCAIVDCMWGDWDEWSACSCSCGGGSMRRSRAVAIAPQNGGKLCEPAERSQVSPCNTQKCELACMDGQWGQWMEWSGCSATCSSGFKSRRRSVDVEPDSCGRPVTGLREEFAVCKELPPCVEDKDCELSDWGEWSHCSCHCFGTRERNRFIKVFASGRGSACDNVTLKVMGPCNPLPGEPVSFDCGNKPATDCVLGTWAEWSVCTVPCGGGQMVRRREVKVKPENGGKPCEDALVVTIPCNTFLCEQRDCLDCVWGLWSEWSGCTKCGGQRFRHRNIERMPNHCGMPCEAKSAKETSNCTSQCQEVTYCAWTEWSEPSCNAPCGLSTTMRNRMMHFTDKRTDGSVIFKGSSDSKCSGSQLNVSVCPSTRSCMPPCEPRSCTFGAWGEWQNPTCEGLCERQRNIQRTNNECGIPCAGPLLETRRCDTACEARRDCELSDWGEWSACPAAAAGSGQRFRARRVVQGPRHGGRPCDGQLYQTTACHPGDLPEPCLFQEWQAWSDCSRSCGSGWRMRSRSIAELPKNGGDQCKGDIQVLDYCWSESPSCMNITKVDCSFSAWGDWSDCGFDSQRSRERSILQLSVHGGEHCRGAMHETETCHQVDVDCIVSEWTSWDACDRTCGGGQTHRQRQVHRFPEHGGETCPRELVQTKGCNTDPCDNGDCRVSLWTDWAECSTSCGVGMQKRSRFVVGVRSPGGAGCNASLAETRGCPGNPQCGVDCQWGNWSDWGGCSCSCDGGQRARNRHIRVAPRNGGKRCETSEKEQVEPCNTQDCHAAPCRDGEFGAWESWGICSASCGGGTSSRHRSIARSANACGLGPAGKSMEVRFCNVELPCEAPVDCVLSEWSLWTECSTSCNGVMRRSRRISTYGKGKGKWCKGALKETWPCHPRPGGEAPEGCSLGEAIDCKLGTWQEWSGCTSSCGGGQHTRVRVVEQQAVFGGRPCEDALSEVRECAREACDVPAPKDCQYGAWSPWGACTKCSGQTLRTRHIVAYPESGGEPCRAIRTEETGECPRKCHQKTYCSWGEWDAWSRCSATCGTGGRRHRGRSLQLSTNPADEPPPPLEDLMDKYQALYQHTKELEEHHFQELFAAFGAGCMSLVVCFAALRSMSYLRRLQGEHMQTGDSRSARLLSRSRTPRGVPQGPLPPYQQLHEIQEDLPLMEVERLDLE